MTSRIPKSPPRERFAPRQSAFKKNHKDASTEPANPVAPEQEFRLPTTTAATAAQPSYRITPFALANRPFDFRGLELGDLDLKQGGLLKIRPTRSAAARLRTPLKHVAVYSRTPSTRGASNASGRKAKLKREVKIKRESVDYGCQTPTPKRGVKRERDYDCVFDVPTPGRVSTPPTLHIVGGIGVAMETGMNVYGRDVEIGMAVTGIEAEMVVHGWNVSVGGGGPSMGRNGMGSGLERFRFVNFSPSDTPSTSVLLPRMPVRTAQSSPTPKSKGRLHIAAQQAFGPMLKRKLPVQGRETPEAIKYRMLARSQAARRATLSEVGITANPPLANGSGVVPTTRGPTEGDLYLQGREMNVASGAACSSPFSGFDPFRTVSASRPKIGGQETAPEETIIVDERNDCMCNLCARAKLL